MADYNIWYNKLDGFVGIRIEREGIDFSTTIDQFSEDPRMEQYRLEDKNGDYVWLKEYYGEPGEIDRENSYWALTFPGDGLPGIGDSGDLKITIPDRIAEKIIEEIQNLEEKNYA